ncbi:hypothetical protein OPKNFCMD_2805 [Methylobacterium crusticola]|uniref:YjiS-like domain-containing protein n=1 Tax=Methylobacterium crusticola TaxID=1697972 RepID=A0ABQ4QXX0_9HYPH|nr:DUF1127 domain-containing protein [Methylobacterium crusticola]GJD50069.1 hypothetical protein OPKNFCMD_2805 [Methylobacterium crusticola]
MTVGFAPFGVLSLVYGLSRKAVRILARLIQIWTHRRAVHRLAELDERALKDIGLTRSDVMGVLDMPFLSDPTLPLVDRRRSRGLRPPPPVSVRIVVRDGRSVRRDPAF